MRFSVAALYKFVSLPDPVAMRETLQALCASFELTGTLLVAPEGINGTLAGAPDTMTAFLSSLRSDPRFAELDVKLSGADAPPFGRLKVRLKREIVTLRQPEADPSRRTGTFVEPAQWNALLDEPGLVVIDTRNGFEVAMGSFVGAVDPKLRHFSDFPDYVTKALDPARHPRVAMFCTGGIRCEKASAYLLAQGFAEVLQLKGGILAYLAEVPEAESRWHGGCFVFDERVALGHGLAVAGPERDIEEVARGDA